MRSYVLLEGLLRIHITKKFYQRRNSSRTYARFISGDNVVPLNDQNITGKLLNYLRTEKTEPQEKTENFNVRQILNLIKPGNLKLCNMSNNDFLVVLKSLETKDIIKNDKTFYKILDILDKESAYLVERYSVEEIFSILDGYINLAPHRITSLKFYRKALDHLFSNRNQLKDKNFIKFIFYVGLMKKDSKSQLVLKDALSVLKKVDIRYLTKEELVVIANSTFKTSTKILNKEILHRMKNYLNENLMLLKEPATFIPMIKTLRQNQYFDEDLLASICCTIFFNKAFEHYTFQTYSHLLALYSENLYYDEILLKFFTQKCMYELNNNSAKIRPKDLVRFLWGMSSLNCSFLTTEEIKNSIVPVILEKFLSHELSLLNLIDVFLYMWLLKYKCHELVPHMMTKRDDLEMILSKTTYNKRLRQLLTFIYYEDRILFRQLNLSFQMQFHTKTSIDQQLKTRHSLQNVLEALKSISPNVNMKFEAGYQVPEVNILGIVGFNKDIYKMVNIEVLDHFTRLKNIDSKPTGLMQGKLRILDGQEEALILVNQTNIEDLTQSELGQMLLEELELVS